jgi:hypothetical protein
MPSVPIQAAKRTGLARFDMAWAFRLGSHFGPLEALPDGAADHQHCRPSRANSNV